MDFIKKLPVIFTLFISLIFSDIKAYSQIEYLDSLEKTLENKKLHDTVVLITLNTLAFDYYRIDPAKTLHFAMKAIEFADKKIKKATPALKNIILEQKSDALNSVGIYYWVMANADSAMYWYRKALVIRKKLNIKGSLAASYNNMANLFKETGDLDSSLYYNLKSLKLKEEIGNKKGIAGSYNSIGFVKWEMNKRKEAIGYFNKALKIRIEIADSVGMAASLNNLGNAYMEEKRFDTAYIYHIQAFKIRKKINDFYGLSESYNNLGLVYENKEMLDSALVLYKKALEMNTSSGNLYLVASNHNNIGSVYFKKKNYQLARDHMNKAMELSKKIGAKSLLKDAYLILVSVYESIGDYKNAYKHFISYKTLEDSMMNENMSKQLIEMQTAYETEKKEASIKLLKQENKMAGLEIERKKIENEKQQVENRNQRIMLYIFMAGLAMIGLFLFVLNRQFSAKKKAFKLLEVQNVEIKQKNEEINAQKDEIEAQRDLLADQNEHITQIHNELTDSIKYAKRIQKAVLPTEKDADELLGEHFIFFMPRDVVSGDFYWFAEKNGYTIAAVADCTGHGVPGGFMSMLGISFMNEILSGNEIMDAAGILNEMRRYVITSLQQSGFSDGQKSAKDYYLAVKDGMDMSVVVWKKSGQKMTFAGANNGMYVYRQQTGVLEEIKPDKMPVAIHDRMNDFTRHEIYFSPGDSIYLLTDGFPDQFGGSLGKKFKYKKFEELLLKNAHKSMEEQKQCITNVLENWMAGHGKTYSQTDDITVMGIRL